jgi:hypothetical protein
MPVESSTLCCVVGGSIKNRNVEYADVRLWQAEQTFTSYEAWNIFATESQ